MPPASRSRRAVASVAVASMFAACAATASPDELFERGAGAFKRGDLPRAIGALETFVGKACGAAAREPRCRAAFVTLGQAYERRGAPALAWAAYDAALALPPHARDAELGTKRDRVEQQLRDAQSQAAARGPLLIRYRDEVTDEYVARAVAISLDFAPAFSNDKDAADLHSAEFHRVYGASVPAGAHVLVVEMAHDCKPGGGARCARSRVRKAWPFETTARTPTTIEIRAYADPGEGDAPSRPALDFVAR